MEQGEPMDADLPALSFWVRERCLAPANRFTAAFYPEHLLRVEEYCRRLAEPCGADLSIVLPAALLHDIAAVEDFSLLAEHAERGALRAEAILRERGYPEAVVSGVRACAALHSVPIAPGEGTPEAVCLSHADALAQISRPAYWLFYAFQIRQFNFTTGCAWYRERLTSHWARLAPFARTMIERDYHLALALLAGAAPEPTGGTAA